MRRDLHQDRERSRTDHVTHSDLVAPPCTPTTPHAIEWEGLVTLFEVRMLAEIVLDRRIIRKHFWAALRDIRRGSDRASPGAP